MHLPMMMFHLMMHFMTRGFLKLFLHLMTAHYFMTGFVVKLGSNSSLRLRYTGKQQAGGNEYCKFSVHDLCFFNCLGTNRSCI